MLVRIQSAIDTAHLDYRGTFYPEADELPEGLSAGSIILLGFADGSRWPHVTQAPEFADGAPDPLDRWSRRVIGALADELGATALFPFGGPPWTPFLRWGMKAEPLQPSTMGMLIHPEHGLWHSWRGALTFEERLELPAVQETPPSPCDSCADKPCLTTCPVSAFKHESALDVAACLGHIGGPEGDACLSSGCQARRACPVGADRGYGPEQSHFHLSSFLKAQTGG